MQRSPVSRSPLSVHRAFVVQFRTETDASLRHVAGRVEHVASQHTASFQSWADLRAFMARVLAEVRARGPEPP